MQNFTYSFRPFIKVLILSFYFLIPQLLIAQTQFIASSSSWFYLDDGVDQTNTGWNTFEFDDMDWQTGTGILGYGDADITTTLDFGNDPNNKHTTYYFRHHFDVTNLDCIAGLTIRLLRDDGAIIYLNGQEIVRSNMPYGIIDGNTFASGGVGGAGEATYQEFQLSATALQAGMNVIAVEVHQHSLSSSDIRFDLELLTIPFPATSHISNFTSLNGGAQDQDLHLPPTHTFQYLVETSDPLTMGGTMPVRVDFAGYVPINGCSTNGYLSVNSEATPGGVTIFDLNYFAPAKRWQVTASEAVDFSSVGGTINNCSGTVTPWNTIITCEENIGGGVNNNGDDYRDFGWAIEVDPVTKTVIDKRWAMGNFEHENVVIHTNERTVYQGRDNPTGFLFKFVTNVAQDLSTGSLYVYKGSKNGNGDWLLLNNTTPEERNTTIQQALNLGATIFQGIEDVEINPLDGKVYFTVKGNNEPAIYRFTDSDPISGTTVQNMEIYAGGVGVNYDVNTVNGNQTVAWGNGNDNLAFDDLGNLWVQQDGSNNLMWVIENGHTVVMPKVKIFGRMPTGSEPTGITFSPDFRFMFMSIQHPATANNANHPDAFGLEQDFNKDVTLVIANNELLGTGANNCPMHLNFTEGFPTGQQLYQAQETITTSGDILVQNQANVNLQAGNSITLTAGFMVAVGNEFSAAIADCMNPPTIIEQGVIFRNTPPTLQIKMPLATPQHFRISPNPARSILNIEALYSEILLTQITITDLAGKMVLQQQVKQSLQSFYTIDLTALHKGTYFVHLLNLDGIFEVQKVVIL